MKTPKILGKKLVKYKFVLILSTNCDLNYHIRTLKIVGELSKCDICGKTFKQIVTWIITWINNCWLKILKYDICADTFN